MKQALVKQGYSNDHAEATIKIGNKMKNDIIDNVETQRRQYINSAFNSSAPMKISFVTLIFAVFHAYIAF